VRRPKVFESAEGLKGRSSSTIRREGVPLPATAFWDNFKNNLKVSIIFMSLVFFFPYKNYVVWRYGHTLFRDREVFEFAYAQNTPPPRRSDS